MHAAGDKEQEIIVSVFNLECTQVIIKIIVLSKWKPKETILEQMFALIY